MSLGPQEVRAAFSGVKPVVDARSKLVDPLDECGVEEDGVGNPAGRDMDCRIEIAFGFPRAEVVFQEGIALDAVGRTGNMSGG